jgi:tryptophan-rich sensory protein
MEISIVLVVVLLCIVVYYSKTDQPVRYMAVIVFAPYIIWKGYTTSDVLLLSFGVGLLVWDLYCILKKSPIKLQC